MGIICLTSSLAFAQRDPLGKCGDCALMHTVTMPSSPICISSSTIDVNFHTALGPNQEILVRVFLNLDPVPIHAEQLLVRGSVSVPVDVPGLYTVIVNCYEIITRRSTGEIGSFRDPGDRRQIGECRYTQNYPIAFDNTMEPHFSINDYSSSDEFMSAMSRRELDGLDWDYGAWINNSLCSDPSTQHKFILEKLDENGAFISIVKDLGWFPSCPLQNAIPNFLQTDYDDFIQNEIVQFRVEVSYKGCINTESVQFRYLGRNGDSSLNLQFVRFASELKGDAFDHTDYSGSAGLNRAERYIIQDCGQEEMPFAGAQFQSITHPNFYYIDEVIVFDPVTGPETQMHILPAKDNIVRAEVRVDPTVVPEGPIFGFTENLPSGEYLFYENNLSDKNTVTGFPGIFYFFNIVNNHMPDDDETFFTYTISYFIDTPTGTDIVSGSCYFYIDASDDGIFYRPISNGIHPVLGSINGVHMSGDLIASDSRLYVFDMNGTIVFEGLLQPDWQQRIMPSLNSGMYIYQIHDGSDIQVGKVIKQ